MPTNRSVKLGLATAAAAVVAAVVVVTLVVVTGDSSGNVAPRPTSSVSAGGTADDGSVDPGPSASSGDQLSPSEAELVQLLDPFSLRACVSAATVPGVDAAVHCQADEVERVRVARYVDAAALSADVDRRAGAIEDVGSCRRGEDSAEDWGRSNRRLGAFLCWTTDAQAGVFWTADAQRLGFEVSGADSTLDAAALVAWWDELDPLR